MGWLFIASFKDHMSWGLSKLLISYGIPVSRYFKYVTVYRQPNEGLARLPRQRVCGIGNVIRSETHECSVPHRFFLERVSKACFVTGHNFSRAEKRWNNEGF